MCGYSSFVCGTVPILVTCPSSDISHSRLMLFSALHCGLYVTCQYILQQDTVKAAPHAIQSCSVQIGITVNDALDEGNLTCSYCMALRQLPFCTVSHIVTALTAILARYIVQSASHQPAVA